MKFVAQCRVWWYPAEQQIKLAFLRGVPRAASRSPPSAPPRVLPPARSTRTHTLVSPEPHDASDETLALLTSPPASPQHPPDVDWDIELDIGCCALPDWLEDALPAMVWALASC